MLDEYLKVARAAAHYCSSIDANFVQQCVRMNS
jgi:hypothetical protein